MLRRTVEDLGLDEVLDTIAGLCLSSEGAKAVRSDTPAVSREPYLERQARVGSIIALYEENPTVRPEAFPDLAPVLEALLAQPRRALPPEEICSVGLYIRAAAVFSSFLALPPRNPASPRLPVDDLVGEVPPSLRALASSIFEVLDPPGEIRKTHPAIARAIGEIERRRLERAAYSKALVSANKDLVQGDRPAFKDSRVVIPLKADRKAEMPGMVHSFSASAQTVFVEPFKLVEHNNRVVLAEENLRIEIAKLLGRLTGEIASCEAELRELSRRVALADSLCAYAVWARGERCCETALSEDGALRLLGCRHPLLRAKAVPITVEMGPDIRAMVISGPNAGGKTVTIKTVGLMALLNQLCGHIPADEGSAMPLYDNVFTDIGDDQSIEAELSTFSGHMRQVGFILRTMTASSLVILDELCSGTDEIEGSAIARAVLQHCSERCRATLVSSHHNALKQFAYVSPGIVNASMEFDQETHRPTFRVVPGLPGESHALDTAIRMRLPGEVIELAKGCLGKDEVSISALIRGLEQKRIEADRRLQDLARREEELREERRKADLRSLRLDQKEYFLKTGKLNELDSFIADSRKSLENLVAELRSAEITREKTLKVKRLIARMEEGEKAFRTKLDSKADSISSREGGAREALSLAPGDEVLCGAHKRQGTVIRADGKGRWQVAIGPMRITLKESELQKAQARETRKVHIEYEIKGLRPKPTLDVRGRTLQEAIDEVSTQIEACLVHGLGSFSIIHGYGDGILSRGIADYLDTQKDVASHAYAMPEDGGQGKTYVTLG